MSISELNINLFRIINDIGKDFTYLNPAMIFIAEYMVLFLALSVLIFWFTGRKTNRIMVLCGFITFLTAEIIGKIAGLIHSNNQPFSELTNVNKLMGHEVDNSFPSDHTILFFSFCMVFYLFKRRSGLLWLILACLVGLSRIWVGVHYPADVIVGAAISICSALIIYRVVPTLRFTENLLAIYEKTEKLILPKKQKSKEF
ncbi:undecaprenyl-diphosphatase [Bacillaceae bacterium C204]|uniref:undecaprenyl-diphosphatase n=1 Tax=Neobacillus sp. 204 TaxID=3383351 RepID=UPI0039789408